MVKLKKSKHFQKKIFTNTYNKKRKLFKSLFNESHVKAVQNGRLSENTVKCIKLRLSRFLKKKGQAKLRRKLIIPISGKAKNARMGKGKGPLKDNAANIRYGHVLLEIQGSQIPLKQKLNFFKEVLPKFSLKVKVIKNEFLLV